MKPAVDDWVSVRTLLNKAKVLLLDFDGPICSVFSGFPAYAVANQLRDTLRRGGHLDLPESVLQSSDPFDILRYAATLGRDEVQYVEAAFTAYECDAIRSARPTPGAHRLIRDWHQTSRPLAVVSNNSRMAIENYLALHGLSALVDSISGRSCIDINRLKPSPDLVQAALSAVDSQASDAIFIGDSLTDIHAGRAAGVTCLAFANRPQKIPGLSKIADITITSLSFI